MKIRIISLLTALILCLSVFSGCSGSESTGSDTDNVASSRDNWKDTVLFMTEDGNFCYISDLDENSAPRILLNSSEATENSIFELPWDYSPYSYGDDIPHYWYSDDGKYIYFTIEGRSSISSLYVTDSTGKNTELLCEDVLLESIIPIKNGLIFSVEVDSSDDTLYTCIDGKAIKIAENVSRFGANKNSDGIYFLRQNTDILGNPYTLFYTPVNGNSSPKIICENVDKYSTVRFGETRDTVLYCVPNDEDAEEKTYSVMLSENGSKPKVIVNDCNNIMAEVYNDTFFYEKYTKDKFDNTQWHATYFDGKKSIDITESKIESQDSVPTVIDRKSNSYFFFDKTTSTPENPEIYFDVYKCIHNGKYIGDVHTNSDYFSSCYFLSDSEFLHYGNDADDNDVLESYKFSGDAPAESTLIAKDAFAVNYHKDEQAIYFMVSTFENGSQSDTESAKLMRYKEGKSEIIAEDLFSRLTRVYEDGTVMAFTGEDRGTLMQYKNGKEEKIGDNIHTYLRLSDGRILFTSDKTLYLYDNGEETRLADNVIRFYSNIGDYGI